jgi:hypothetical protein
MRLWNSRFFPHGGGTISRRIPPFFRTKTSGSKDLQNIHSLKSVRTVGNRRQILAIAGSFSFSYSPGTPSGRHRVPYHRNFLELAIKTSTVLDEKTVILEANSKSSSTNQNHEDPRCRNPHRASRL